LKCKYWDGIPEHYMFSKELGRIRHILDDFNKVAEDSKKNGQADECDAGKMFIQKEMSRVIAISGERGSGKTSLLKSLKNILEKEYHVFDIIGPGGEVYQPRIINGKQSCWRWSKTKVELEYDSLVFKNNKVK